jgi:hypothetical protein
MEYAGSRPTINQGTIHGTGYAGTGVTSYYTLPAGQAFYSAYHVFAVDWRPGSIKFSVDGHVYSTMTPASLPAGGRWLFDHPFYMILNVNAGGSFGGPTGANSTFPQTMLVDYVRAYAPPDVVGRSVFYNDSAFDGNNAAANAADDGAVAPDKTALRPGVAASFVNVTSYTKGINGVMVDVRGLPAGTSAPTPGDFTFRTGNAAGNPATWVAAPAPRAMSIRRGAGAGGSDRVTFVWDDYQTAGLDRAVGNAWLEVTVQANDRTGLVAPDVFSFSNLIGESGDAGSPLRVTALDVAATRRALRGAVPAATTSATSRTDFNRDGRVNVLDIVAARRAQGQFLAPASAQGTALLSAPDRDRGLVSDPNFLT